MLSLPLTTSDSVLNRDCCRAHSFDTRLVSFTVQRTKDSSAAVLAVQKMIALGGTVDAQFAREVSPP